MKKCCLCRKVITNDEPAVLFIGEAGDNKEICETCEQKMKIITGSNNPTEIKDAIHYFNTSSMSASDPEVEEFLQEQIEANSSVVDKEEENNAKNEPADIQMLLLDLAKKVSKMSNDISEIKESLRIINKKK